MVAHAHVPALRKLRWEDQESDSKICSPNTKKPRSSFAGKKIISDRKTQRVIEIINIKVHRKFVFFSFLFL